MTDAGASDDARHRQRTTHAVANDSPPRDEDNVSLLLRPAEFDDERRDGEAEASRATSDSHGGPSRHLRSHTALGSLRGSAKRRELVELAGNPFVINPHGPRADGQSQFRQDIYPAYDASGRRIGLEHVRNPEGTSETKGYYRKHVHEYDKTRGAPLPLPMQEPVHSNYPEQGPLPPVSAVIAGIPAETPCAVDSFSHIQNRPRTPQEVLGLSPDAPLNLWSLLDPETPDAKPQYNYHVLVKLAILGNKGQKATLQDILRAIRLRFAYYRDLPKAEAVAFGNSIRHLLSLLAAFVREPKPVTEPGKGAYWKVDFSKGEGNKRVRKRNKPQKKTQNGHASDKQDNPDSRSGSDESQPPTSASTQSTSQSSISQSPIETPPPSRTRVRNKGGRKPAPKNLIQTPGGTATVAMPSSAEAPQDEFYTRLDPALMSNTTSVSAPLSHGTSTAEPYLQLHPSNAGAHRGRVARGSARSAPYPSTLVMSRSPSSSGSRSGSSEVDNQYSSTSPVDAAYRNGQRSSLSPISVDTPPPHEYPHSQQRFIGSGVNQGYEQGGHHGPAYAQQYVLSNGGRYVHTSPQESPVSTTHPITSPYTEQGMLPPSSSSQYSNYSSRSCGLAPLNSPSSASPVTGPSSAVSQSSSYGLTPYAERRQSGEIDATVFGTMHRMQRHSTEHTYASNPSWDSMRNNVESSGARR